VKLTPLIAQLPPNERERFWSWIMAFIVYALYSGGFHIVLP
jgi:hypothetical protein